MYVKFIWKEVKSQVAAFQKEFGVLLSWLGLGEVDFNL